MTHNPEAWRWFFPSGALVGGLGAFAWAAGLGGFGPLLAPGDHGAFMIFGVLGFFVHGFLLTAYAKQNQAAPPGARQIGVTLLLQGVSASVAWWGGGLPPPIRALFLAAPWGLTLVWALPVARGSLTRAWDSTTFGVPVALSALGLAALAFPYQGRLALHTAVHSGLILLALAVLDRVLPFFCQRPVPGYQGRRKPGFVEGLAVLLWGRGLLPYVGVDGGLLAIVDLLVVALLLRQLVGWAPWPALKVPMLGVLFLGVTWIIFGYLLDAAVSVGLLVAGTAPLHTLVLGGLGTLVVGIATRVAQGHSGLPIRLGIGGGVVLGLVQAATVLRLGAAVFGAGSETYALAALFFAMGLLGWLGRFGRRPGEGGAGSRA